MKELFEELPKLAGGEKADYFVDTCFIYWIYNEEHSEEFYKFCKENKVALTSFNAEEIIYHSHDVAKKFRVHFRTAIKKGLRIYYKEIPVHPGNPEEEKEYVKNYDEELARIIPDPSDAVLAVTALKEKANVLTRDKHHLFTTKLENYFEKEGVKVYSTLPK